MKDLSAFDIDEAALAKKPKPIGWFAAGIIAIGALGFAAAYYMPLHSAHGTLLEKHEQLAKKSNELDQALKAKVQSLKTTTERKDDLERFLKKGRDAESKVKSQVDVAQATAENQLKAYIKAKLVHVDPSHEKLTIAFSERAVFSRGSERIVPQVKRQLCKAVESAGKNDFRLVAEVRVAEDEKDAWELAGKRAAGIGAVLAAGCKLSADTLAVQAVLAGKDEVKDALVLHLGPDTTPRLRASDAPSE